MVAGKKQGNQEAVALSSNTPFSWWSWRPGLKPQYALALGGTLALIGLLLTSLGLFLLFFSIWDQHSPLQPISATILHHQTGQPPTLTVQIHNPDLPATASLIVSTSAYQLLLDTTKIQVLYSQHLQIPLVILASGQRYPLAESSSLDEPGNALLPFLFGLILLIYPAVLARWGWRDLFIERVAPEQLSSLLGKITDKRQVKTTQSSRPGRISTGKGGLWHGIALQPLIPDKANKQQSIITFRIDEERFLSLQEGDYVQIRYSPHLHYVYSVSNENAANQE